MFGNLQSNHTVNAEHILHIFELPLLFGSGDCVEIKAGRWDLTGTCILSLAT